MAKRKTKPELDSSVVAPSVRVFTDWSPAKLRTAERQAESGDLSQAVAVCEWLLSDDRVVGTLNPRINALLGLQPTFEPSGDRRRSNRAVKALEAGEDFWTAYPESQLSLMLKWGLLLGAAPMRHGWVEREDHGGRVLPMPEFFHPQTLRYDNRARKWTVRDADNVEHVVVPGDGEWILHTPFGSTRPWGSGFWRSLARWVLLKHYAILDWARHGEKASLLVATSEKNSTKEQRRELAQDLSASGSDRIVALAAGFNLKLIEVAANTERIYKAQIEAANEAIAILVRGGNLSTNVSEGSRAAAEVQERTGDNVNLRFDAESTSSTLHDQSLVWWAEFNYGDGNLAPWPVWPVEPEEDKKQRADMVESVGRGVKQLDELGFLIDDKKLIEEFGLTFVKGRKPDEQRAQEAAEAFERQKTLVGGGEPGDGDPKDPKAPKAPKPAPKKDDKAKQSAGGFVARLASGGSVADNQGFVAGQMYADDVVDGAAPTANELLEPMLMTIAREVEAATSYEDLRERLRTLHADLDATDLNELVYRVMNLAQLAGRRAVTQDG